MTLEPGFVPFRRVSAAGLVRRPAGKPAPVSRGARRRGGLYFSALLPESVFREGRNDVRVCSVSGFGPGLRLRALG